MSTAPIVAARQNRYIRTFRHANATNPTSATTLADLHLRDSHIFHRLVAQGVFVRTTDAHFYLDESTTKAWHTRRRKRALIILTLLLAAAITSILLTR